MTDIFTLYSTSSFVLATFQVVNSHLWLVAIVLDSTGLDGEQNLLMDFEL